MLEGNSGDPLVQPALPCSEQSHLQEGAWDGIQLGMNGLHNLSGQPILMFNHPKSKNIFLTFKQDFLCFGLCPLLLVTSLDTAEKSLALSSLNTRREEVYTLVWSTLHSFPAPLHCLLQGEHLQLSQTSLLGQILSSLNHFCGCPPSLGLF